MSDVESMVLRHHGRTNGSRPLTGAWCWRRAEMRPRKRISPGALVPHVLYPLYACPPSRILSRDAQDFDAGIPRESVVHAALVAFTQRKADSVLLARLAESLPRQRNGIRPARSNAGRGQPAISLDTAEPRYRADARGDVARPDLRASMGSSPLAQVAGPLASKTTRPPETGRCSRPCSFTCRRERSGAYPRGSRPTGLEHRRAQESGRASAWRRYGKLLREEIAHTVSDPAEVDEENPLPAERGGTR